MNCIMTRVPPPWVCKEQINQLTIYARLTIDSVRTLHFPRLIINISIVMECRQSDLRIATTFTTLLCNNVIKAYTSNTSYLPWNM